MWRASRSIASALALLLTSAAWAAEWKSAAREHFEEGQKLQAQALYPLAIDQYQMSLASESHPETEKAIAECFAAADQHLLAATHFDRYLTKEPQDPEAWNRMGGLWLKVNRLEEAANAFRKLKTFDPESAKTGLFLVELKLGERAYTDKLYRKSADHFLAAEALAGMDDRAMDGIAKSLRALMDQQLAKDPAAALATGFDLYDRGMVVGLRERLVQAFLKAGQPKAHDKRMKKILGDPRMK